MVSHSRRGRQMGPRLQTLVDQVTFKVVLNNKNNTLFGNSLRTSLSWLEPGAFYFIFVLAMVYVKLSHPLQ